MIKIGIDPGLDGAVAVKIGNKVTFYDTPTLTIKKGKKNKRSCNPPLMADILRQYKGQDVHIVLEKVHSMPGQGVASMFSMGEGFGMWQGIIAALQFKLTMVTPQAWKKKVMAGMGKEKDVSRQRALQLYPQLAEDLKLKKHHGRADALLLTEMI